MFNILLSDLHWHGARSALIAIVYEVIFYYFDMFRFSFVLMITVVTNFIPSIYILIYYKICFYIWFTDLGFYALPAKEELSPMFPHNSSSHEISTETNAFVQNSMVSVNI